MNKLIKRYLPQSLLGRSIMIVIVPILAVQAVVAYIFIDRLYGDVSIGKTTEVAREINYVFKDTTLNGSPSDLSVILSKSQPLALTVSEIAAPRNENARGFWDISGRFVTAKFKSEVRGLLSVDLLTDEKRVILTLERFDTFYQIGLSRGRVSASNPHQLLVASTLASLLFLGLAVLFLKNQVKPISQLAKSAEAFGKGRKEKFAPRGAAEVRRAGHAFISMQSRIERQIEQRTSMLSGVSHDLRTPLTRMKLSLSMMGDDPQINDLQGDVLEMERIMEEFLAFARGDSGEPVIQIDIRKLVKSIIRDRKRLNHIIDLKFTGQIEDGQIIKGKEQALRRAINNLLANTKRYATNCHMTVSIETKTLSIIIEDDGPGIPKASREDAVLPFERLDASRNQNKGTGTGLGLAITADIARSHGGELLLDHSQTMGGLKAVLTIPR